MRLSQGDCRERGRWDCILVIVERGRWDCLMVIVEKEEDGIVSW